MKIYYVYAPVYSSDLSKLSSYLWLNLPMLTGCSQQPLKMVIFRIADISFGYSTLALLNIDEHDKGNYFLSYKELSPQLSLIITK